MGTVVGTVVAKLHKILPIKSKMVTKFFLRASVGQTGGHWQGQGTHWMHLIPQLQLLAQGRPKEVQ